MKQYSCNENMFNVVDQVSEMFKFKTPPPKSRERGYLPWKLHPLTIGGLVFVNLSMIAIIAALLEISTKRSGFTTVHQTADLSSLPFTFFSFAGTGKLDKYWSYSLLWTVLPTFVISVYIYGWGSIISELEDRQPFIELADNSGSAGAKTLLLDYRQHLPPIRLFKAFSNGHFVLGVTILLGLLSKVALVPLASHLFAVTESQNHRTESLLRTSVFNESAFTSKSDIGNILNLVLATRNLGASLPPWTLGRYAFPEFTMNDSSILPVVGTRLDVNSTAYSADLDCVTVSNYSSSTNPDGTGVAVTFSATDRGCNIRKSLYVDSGVKEYIQTSAVIDCDSDNTPTRLLLISGSYDASTTIRLSNVNFISCVPSYWTTAGTLSTTASQDVFVPPMMLDFRPFDQSFTFQWKSSSTFETGIHLAATFDPTAASQSSAFGLIVSNFARKNNISSSNDLPLTSPLLINATTEIFQSTFAFTANSILLKSSSNPIPVEAMSSTPISRVFVVPWIAGPMLGILLLIAVFTLIVGFQSYRVTSILREEPHGMLGLALVLASTNFRNEGPDAHLTVTTQDSSKPSLISGHSTRDAQQGFCSWIVAKFWSEEGYTGGHSYNELVKDMNVKGKMFIAPTGEDGKRVIVERP